MNRIKNYNDYADFIRMEVLKGNRPHTKSEYGKWKKRGETRIYEFHHVIPRCVGGDDSEYNVIPLTPREHFLAHYLLLTIYKDTEFEYSLLCAFNIITHTSGIKILSSKAIERQLQLKVEKQTGRKFDKSFCDKQKYIQNNRSKTWKENISKSKIGALNGMSHSKWVNDGKTSKVIDVSDLQKYLESGWFLGRLKSDMPSRKRAIKCSNGKVYDSAKEAQLDTGVSASCICFFLKGKTKSLRSGLIFEYI